MTEWGPCRVALLTLKLWLLNKASKVGYCHIIQNLIDLCLSLVSRQYLSPFQRALISLEARLARKATYNLIIS